ncbi:glycosyltransferase family 2 protein [Enterobacter ludwigii]
MNNLHSAIVIPTYNGGILWKQVADSIREFYHGRVVVVDSGSTDQTVPYAQECGFEVYQIPNQEFNHGGTRNYGASLVADTSDIVIFMTQDAILQNDKSIKNFIKLFEENDTLAAVYGKQLPHDDANPVATHARIFNYSDHPYIVNEASAKISEIGIKAVFMSNSFSAYRLSLFNKIGGFANNTILCEDMLFAANALVAGMKVGYQPLSSVKHSHNYSPIEEFKRYFDIGVFHCQQAWIGKRFGGTKGEGAKFIKSELRYLLKNAPHYIPLAFMNDFCKIVGYKLGKQYLRLPLVSVKKLSMHKRFWK